MQQQMIDLLVVLIGSLAAIVIVMWGFVIAFFNRSLRSHSSVALNTLEDIIFYVTLAMTLLLIFLSLGYLSIYYDTVVYIFFFFWLLGGIWFIAWLNMEAFYVISSVIKTPRAKITRSNLKDALLGYTFVIVAVFVDSWVIYSLADKLSP